MKYKYKKKVFEVELVDIADIIKGEVSCLVLVAEMDLWYTIKKDFYKCVDGAIKADEDIFFYCERGYFKTNPSYEEMVEHIKKSIEC